MKSKMTSQKSIESLKGTGKTRVKPVPPTPHTIHLLVTRPSGDIEKWPLAELPNIDVWKYRKMLAKIKIPVLKTIRKKKVA